MLFKMKGYFFLTVIVVFVSGGAEVTLNLLLLSQENSISLEV